MHQQSFWDTHYHYLPVVHFCFLSSVEQAPPLACSTANVKVLIKIKNIHKEFHQKVIVGSGGLKIPSVYAQLLLQLLLIVKKRKGEKKLRIKHQIIFQRVMETSIVR